MHMSLGEALADLFKLHGHAVTADAALEGRTGTVHTVPLLAEHEGRAIVVLHDLRGGLLASHAVHEARELCEDVGADLAVLCHLGPLAPDARAAAGAAVVLWGQDLLARLLGEAVLARAVDGEPSPLPFTNPEEHAEPALAESVSDLMPAAFQETEQPAWQAPEDGIMSFDPDALAAAATHDDADGRTVAADSGQDVPEVIGIPLPGEDAPPLEAMATPAPRRLAPRAVSASPAYAPPSAAPMYTPTPTAPTYAPAPAAFTPAPVSFEAAPPFASAPAFAAPAMPSFAPTPAPTPAYAPAPTPMPSFSAPELDPIPFLPPTAAAKPVPASKPVGPQAAPNAMLPVRLTAEDAVKKVKERLFGVERHELILQPVHLYDYECDLLAEGSLRTDTVDGRVQLHGTDKSALAVDPDAVNPSAPSLLASTFGLQVVEKVLRVSEERARQLATEFVVKTHTRLVDVQVKDADSRYFYTEKRKVAPQTDHVRLSHVGVFHRPIWRLWGNNGTVDVDALDGHVVEQQLRNSRSDAVLLD